MVKNPRSWRFGRLVLLAAVSVPLAFRHQSAQADRAALLSEAIAIRPKVVADSALIDGCSVYRMLGQTANYLEMLDQRVRDRIEVRGPEPCSPLPPKRRTAPIVAVRAVALDSSGGTVAFAVNRGAIAYMATQRFVAAIQNPTLNVTAIGSRWRLKEILIDTFLIH